MTSDGSAAHRARARAHAQRRAWQRFGLALAEPDLRQIETQLLTREASPAGPVAGRVHSRIHYRGRQMIVVFDLQLSCVVTFMPIGWRRLA